MVKFDLSFKFNVRECNYIVIIITKEKSTRLFFEYFIEVFEKINYFSVLFNTTYNVERLIFSND